MSSTSLAAIVGDFFCRVKLTRGTTQRALAFASLCILWSIQVLADEVCLPGTACYAERATLYAMGEQTERMSNSLNDVSSKLPQFSVLAKQFADLTASFRNMERSLIAGHEVSVDQLRIAIANLRSAIRELATRQNTEKTEFRLALEDALKVSNELDVWLNQLKVNQLSKVDTRKIVQELSDASKRLAEIKIPPPQAPADVDPDAEIAGKNGDQIDPKVPLELYYPDAQIQALVIAVPDPRVPKTQRNFDLVLGAIHRAFAQAKFRYSRHIFPWRKDAAPERPFADDAALGLPIDFGLVTYTNQNAERADTVFAVYLVAERTSQGPSSIALTQALRATGDRSNVRLIVPFYPENEALWQWQQYRARCLWHVQSCTKGFEAVPTSRDSNVVDLPVTNRKTIYLPSNIFEIRSIGDSKSIESGKDKSLPVRQMLWRERNELDLSADRGDEWPATYATSTTARTLDLWLDEQLKILYSPPRFTGSSETPQILISDQQTINTQAHLNVLVAQKATVLIDMTSVLDQIFVARRIRESYPDLSLGVRSADLLFAHPSFLSATRGIKLYGNLERTIEDTALSISPNLQFSNDESATIFCKVFAAIAEGKKCRIADPQIYEVTRHGLIKHGQLQLQDLHERIFAAVLGFLIIFVAVELLFRMPTLTAKTRFKCGVIVGLVIALITLFGKLSDDVLARYLLMLPGLVVLAFPLGRLIRNLEFSWLLWLVIVSSVLGFAPSRQDDYSKWIFGISLMSFIWSLGSAFKQRSELDRQLAGNPTVEGLEYIGHPLIPSFSTPFAVWLGGTTVQPPMLGVSRLIAIRHAVANEIALLRSTLLFGLVYAVAICFACYLYPQPQQNSLLAIAFFFWVANALLLWVMIVSFEKNDRLNQIFCRGIPKFEWSGVVFCYLLLPLTVLAVMFVILLQPGTTFIGSIFNLLLSWRI